MIFVRNRKFFILSDCQIFSVCPLNKSGCKSSVPAILRTKNKIEEEFEKVKNDQDKNFCKVEINECILHLFMLQCMSPHITEIWQP